MALNKNYLNIIVIDTIFSTDVVDDKDFAIVF